MNMARPNLTPQERAAIVTRLSAKVSYPDIAAEFGCSIDNVKYYARKMKPKIAAVQEKRAVRAISAGLSEVDARVAQLEWLNELLAADLAGGMYGTDIKMSASGKQVEVPAFKGAQMAQLRGTLDDIAKERGGRKTNLKVDGGLNVTHTYADILAAAEAHADGSANDHEPER